MNFEQKLPWYIHIMVLLLIIWLLPFVLAYYLFSRLIYRPITYLFGGKSNANKLYANNKTTPGLGISAR